MQIKIIEVGPSSQKQSAKGTTYSMFTLKYEADGKTREKKIMSFNKTEFALKSAVAGEVYEIDLKQNGEYWDWVKVTRVENSSGESTAAKPAASKGNWETPEERARRQVYIMRQNALTNAVAYCDAEASVEQVLDVAERFAAWSANIEGDDDTDPEIM